MFKFNATCLKLRHHILPICYRVNEDENGSFKLYIELHPFFRFVVHREQYISFFVLLCVEKEDGISSHEVHAGRRRPRGKDSEQCVYALVQ